jgi:hypothetical protein
MDQGNKMLNNIDNKNQWKFSGKVVSWFQSSWLLVECYMYRKIAEAFFLT